MRGVIFAALATLLLWPGVGSGRPNVVVILADDLGYSDIGAYGGEIRTPQLDALAEQGVRFTQFSVTPRCSPTRAALLTGLDSHQAGFGHLPDVGARVPAYRGVIPEDVETLPERLREAGYATYMAGKWHLTRHSEVEPDTPNEPHPSWPRGRGFDRFYGTLKGAGSYFRPRALLRDDTPIESEGEDYYYTDAVSAEAAHFLREHAAQRPETPFFLYLAYTAPHWPLHAPEEEIARQAGRYEEGWDALRVQRFERMRQLGVVPQDAVLSERDPEVPAWDDAPHRAWQVRRMQVYAAMIERMDRGIGSVLDALRETGALDDTLLLFLSDNGGCSEGLPASDRWLRRLLGLRFKAVTRDGRSVPYGSDPSVLPGDENSFQSYGRGWSNASNTPLRLHKSWVHEGGVASPLIVRWPDGVGVPAGALIHEPAHVVDVTATILDAAGVPAPELRGETLRPLLEGHTRARAPIFWEHEGNRGVRDGRWKLVAVRGDDWELYDLAMDRTETQDLAGAQPERVQTLAERWDAWAEEVGVEAWPWVVPLAQRLLAGIVVVALAVIGLGWWLVRRRLAKRAALLVCLSFLSLSGCTREVKLSLPDGFNGIWQTEGYGYIVEIRDGSFSYWDVTDYHMIERELDWHTRSDFDPQLLEEDRVLFAFKDTSNLKFYARRLASMPEAYSRRDEFDTDDPITNFEVFWHTFNEHYAFLKERQIDWDETYGTYRPRVTEDTDDEELFAILVEMIKPLRDMHIGFSRGFADEWMNLDLLPDYVDRDDVAEMQSRLFWQYVTFRLGDDGRLARTCEETVFKDVIPVIKQTYLGNRYTTVCNGQIFYGKPNDQVGYVFIAREGSYVEDLGEPDAESRAALKGALDDMVRAFRDVDAIIVDLRLNLGGQDQLGLDITERFADRRQKVLSKRARDGDSLSPKNDLYVDPEGKQVFRARNVYVLTSGATVSAGENLTIALSSLPQVTVIGERSMGVLSDTLSKKLPNGWSFTTSNEIFYSHDGVVYEADPRPPDVEVDVDMEGFARGQDRILDRALQMASARGS